MPKRQISAETVWLMQSEVTPRWL